MRKISFPFILLSFLLFPILYAYPKTPSIVSLSPPITEELYTLGLGENIVANSIYCTKPDDAKRKKKVGSVIHANVEEIIKLNPDYVFASPFLDSKVVKKLEEFGLKVKIFPHPKNFDEVCSRFIELASIFGKKDFGEMIVKEAKARYLEIKKEVQERGLKPKVFVQLGMNPLFTATSESILNSFVEDAGGINIAKESKTGLYSKEQVLLEDPDIILIVSMGLKGEKEKERWLRTEKLKAARLKRVYVIESDKFCSPTVLSYVRSLKEMREIFLGRGR